MILDGFIIIYLEFTRFSNKNMKIIENASKSRYKLNVT